MIDKKSVNINESRFEDWKGNCQLTFIDRKIGNPQIDYKGQRFDYDSVCEELGVVASDMKYAGAEDIIRACNSLLKKNRTAINETRYDFNHIDSVTGMPRIKERPEDKIELMNRMPARSCWITMLQNRVNLNSVGNKRYKKTVWFDRTDCTVSSDRNKEDAVHFRRYMLPGAGYPQGWMYENEFKR